MDRGSIVSGLKILDSVFSDPKNFFTTLLNL